MTSADALPAFRLDERAISMERWPLIGEYTEQVLSQRLGRATAESEAARESGALT